MSKSERMILSNDALYLARRLLPHSDDPIIAIEMDHLTHRGENWFNQELVVYFRVHCSSAGRIEKRNRFRQCCCQPMDL